MSAEDLNIKVVTAGDKVRELKVAKADAEAIKAAVAALLEAKAEFKTATGADWKPPAAAGAAAAAPAAKKEEKKEEKKKKAEKKEGKKEDGKKDGKKGDGKKEEGKKAEAAPAPVYSAPKGLTYYPSVTDGDANMKCLLLAAQLSTKMAMDTGLTPAVPRLPCVSDQRGAVLRFGANAVCRYLCESSNKNAKGDFSSAEIDALLDVEEAGDMAAMEGLLAAADKGGSSSGNSKSSSSAIVSSVLFPKALAAKTPACSALATTVRATDAFAATSAVLSGGLESLEGFDFASAGLLYSLKLLFSHAILKAYPRLCFVEDGKLLHADVARCGNPNFGDFQCNSAMAIAKALKGTAGYTGATIPKDIGALIAAQVPANPFIEKTNTMPNGFVNVTLRNDAICSTIAGIVSKGPQPPHMPKKTVLVDFSSPNIAKEMHVGHLRSTIIGDAVCRILEFCGHHVDRTNHVGDWGTQFGMLITYLKEDYPDILTNPPNITDLTSIYKNSKKRFDDDVDFKDRSRKAVVALQAGDPESRAIWNVLCDLSRVEFQKVYDLLGVELEEVGESFYNPMIPAAIELCNKAGIVTEEEAMLIIKLAHFTIPLIVRKSDGGYGYDSTDLAAIHYRLFEKKSDWVIYITDAGQAPHFHMIFDAAKAAGWVKGQRLDHIGFGVVCGDDGKRFKTRSSETVRLIDLLDAAKDRMRDSLSTRASEGKVAVSPEELEASAAKIGYGAVKYFDLKQNPQTNYIFSYDRMLDTKGDTAVYLMFAYARLASILKKAAEEFNVDLIALKAEAGTALVLKEHAERALAFELMQLGDVIKSVLRELLPNRLCDYLQSISVKFTDFVTKCRVLDGANVDVMRSRLVLCEGTRQVMALCFSLLGIDPLERI